MYILQAINKTGQGLEMRLCWWNVCVMDMHGLFLRHTMEKWQSN